MAKASPTPFNLPSFANNGRFPRQRAPSRNHAPRPSQRRHSPLSALSHADGFSADAPALQSFSVGDSSDDEIPKPMNFSALTKALLEDRPSGRALSPPHNLRDAGSQYTKKEPDETEGRARESRAGTPSAGRLRIARRSPPQDVAGSESAPRVVHLSGSRNSSGLRRAASTVEGIGRATSTEEGSSRARTGTEMPREYITPAPVPRSRSAFDRRANSETEGDGFQSQSGSDGQRSGASSNKNSRVSSESKGSSAGNMARGDHEGSAQAKSRSTQDGNPNSMRVKRVPLGSGMFLRGAPVRRGFRQRQSEEEQSHLDDEIGGSRISNERPQEEDWIPEPQKADPRPSEDLIDIQDFGEKDQQVGRSNEKQSAGDKRRPPLSRSMSHQETDALRLRKRSPSRARQPLKQDMSSSAPLEARPVFRIPAPPLAISSHDQENEPPPTFKRNKPQVSGMLGESNGLSTYSEDKKGRAEGGTGVDAARPALAPLSQNTPMRVAPPPPPKMSVVDTATAKAGASTVKKRKARHAVINGKMFSIRGGKPLGRGGSSIVWRVMAENDNMFALKKVNLEDCNEETVRGYKAEIELLKKLENVDRVVRLLDWEVNEQKQSLSILMEMGETNLNSLLTTRLQPEDATLDLPFTRHYWREMALCVAAVHAHDIVHSDLKPANFLLVQGRLKLIDFGIANAIDTDNTVNVHRDTNVGTPNYMSPESLQDTNNTTASEHRHCPGPKLMKLGKPSDVWSLGCILYQMTYGRPPFAHIPNTWNRVMAIINPKVAVSYPILGVGAAYVPACLRRLLQRCLNRDAAQRPTIQQLLGEREAFLNPDAEGEGAVPMTEELLEQILGKVVERCRDGRRGLPSQEEVRTYPRNFLDRLRRALEQV